MLKKLMSVILALSLVLGMGTVAIASEVKTPVTSGTITVKNIKDDTALELYKIISYDTNAEGAIYNPVFTNEAYKTAIANLVKSKDAKADTSTDAAIIAQMGGLTGEAIVAALKDVVTNPVDVIGKRPEEKPDNQVTYSVDMGYYYIKDVTDYTNYTSSNPVVMLQPMEPNVTVTLKSESHKEIKKEASTVNGEIGKVVEFTVTGYVPSETPQEGGRYTYTIVDTMTAGLTYNSDAKIYKNDSETAMTVENTAAEGETLRFVFTEENVVPGDKITIKYSATVNPNAVHENKNEVYDQGNDPSDKLTTDVVEVFTYDIKVIKTDEFEAALEGVKFVLYTKTTEEGVDTINYLQFTDGKLSGTTTDLDAATEIVTGNDGTVTVKGLAAGTYYLKETYTLPGYNPLTEDKKVVISAVNPEVTEGRVFQAETTVVNYSGIELPGTGGIGTTAFTAIGSVMMMSAAAFLFLNKKRNVA